MFGPTEFIEISLGDKLENPPKFIVTYENCCDRARHARN